MKLLFDQNLSRLLVRRLAADFPGSAHVAERELDTGTDREIWEYAGQHGFVIVSKDSDFRQLALLFGCPPHVVWLNIGNASTDAIEELLRHSKHRLDAFVASGDESLLVLTSTP